MGTKGSYKEFREMLRRGIGSRGQKEFAKSIGISPEHLNRMLNNEEIPRPSRQTLAKIVRNVNNMTLNDFLQSCGYPPMEIEERVEKLEKDIMDGINAMKTKIWGSMEEMDQTLRDEYLEEAGWFCRDGDEETMFSEDAELCAPVSFHWDARPYSCVTRFKLYFSRTLRNRIVLAGTSLGEDAAGEPETGKMILHTEVVEKPKKQKVLGGTAEERLLEAIFGGSGFEPSVVVGYGIRFDKTPEGFMDFTYSHSGSFVTGRKEAALYQKSLLPDMDADDVYADYSYKDGAPGTGSVVAKIMEMETGMPFRYYDSRHEDFGDAFVMVKAPDNGESDVPKDLINKLLMYAKELKAPEFGMCYHHTKIGIRTTQIFKTDNLYIQFK